MRHFLKVAACAAALAALPACGENRGSDGLTAEEREKLNSHAENLQKQDVVDTSPDSLTVEDEWTEAENGVAPANGAAAAPGNAEAPNGQ